jgi:hypothetical protein
MNVDLNAIGPPLQTKAWERGRELDEVLLGGMACNGKHGGQRQTVIPAWAKFAS